MRRSAALLARLTAVTAVAGAALLLAAPPALAGGPTSVLLASPAAQRTASLYYSDADYDRLFEALGQSPVADKQAPALHGGPGTPAINVTWLAHDVNVWRVDRVFLDVTGGPWAESLLDSEGRWLSEAGVVYRPANPAVLLELLGKYGLVGSLPAKQTEPPPAPAQVAADAEDTLASPIPAAAVTPEKAADPNWLWLLIGAAAGAVIVVGLRPVIGVLRVRSRAASSS